MVAHNLYLLPRAQRDLATIWDYSFTLWSETQADRYVAGLHQAMLSLWEAPLIARERDEIVPPVRLWRYRRHLIVFRVKGRDLHVLGIPGARQDWVALLG
ncbi:MAG: type II toxin-antitoxin system RelE/ParE family toxin [Paracoccus sp. (in: a-proteobacteria)]|nr:type II toxin-antitoxin system RelE/ParE family toxin [Paracoccus sp. (in: a-proteobacteria)]